MINEIDEKITYDNEVHKKIWPLAKSFREESSILIGGVYGSGKSVLLNTILWSYLAFPDYYFFIDLRLVELFNYKTHPNTREYATDIQSSLKLLRNIISIMDSRVDEVIKEGKTKSDRPIIHVVIDELFDVAIDKEFMLLLSQIIMRGRAANIHVLMVTNNPTKQVIPDYNIASCGIALRCKTTTQSKNIIGVPGAEKLPLFGQGLMYNKNGLQLIKIPMIDEEDIKLRVNHNV